MAIAFAPNRVAVITGAASGIGRAAALRAGQAGMKVLMIDTSESRLVEARSEVAAIAGPDRALSIAADVADARALARIAKTVETHWGAPALLMNNAGTFVHGGPGGILDPLAGWRRVIEVNLMGAVNGVAAFLPGMLAAGERCTIVNTGSKQGITNPPGNPAYNTSKAALNAYTQNLALELRDRPGGKISAHLLIPGWTNSGDEPPRAAAWMPEEVVEFMVEAMRQDEFFILCPDNETSTDTDRKRILWNALDMILGRPALSRWHVDYKEAFTRFMAKDLDTDSGP